MSKFFNSPTVGIDVSAEFSYAAILAPNGDVSKKAFRIKHDLSGFNHVSLFHFLNKNFENTFVINPLVTKCNKNVDIKKVKMIKKMPYVLLK